MGATSRITMGSGRRHGRSKQIDTALLRDKEMFTKCDLDREDTHTSDMVADVLSKPMTAKLMNQLVHTKRECMTLVRIRLECNMSDQAKKEKTTVLVALIWIIHHKKERNVHEEYYNVTTDQQYRNEMR